MVSKDLRRCDLPGETRFAGKDIECFARVKEAMRLRCVDPWGHYSRSRRVHNSSTGGGKGYALRDWILGFGRGVDIAYYIDLR